LLQGFIGEGRRKQGWKKGKKEAGREEGREKGKKGAGREGCGRQRERERC